MPDTPAAARWRKLIAEHAKTDLSTRAFAEKHGLNLRTYKWWRSRLKKLDAEVPVFTELVVARSEPTLVLALDDLPAHIVVDSDTDLPLLKRLLVELC